MSTSPMAPSRTSWRAFWITRVPRLCDPTCTTRPVRRAVSSRSRPSRILWAHGFSTYTCFPASQASIAMGACQWSGGASTTASTEGSSRTSRKSATAFPAPVCSRARLRRSSSGSHTQATRAPRSTKLLPTDNPREQPMIPMTTLSLAPAARAARPARAKYAPAAAAPRPPKKVRRSIPRSSPPVRCRRWVRSRISRAAPRPRRPRIPGNSIHQGARARTE